MMLAAVIVLGVVAAAGWWAAVYCQRGWTRAEHRVTREIDRSIDAARDHALHVARHKPLPDIDPTQAQQALARLWELITKADHARQLTGWVSTGSLARVVDLLDPPTPTTASAAAAPDSGLELFSRLYEWLGRHSSEPGGDEWSHDHLRHTVKLLLRDIPLALPTEQPGGGR